MFSVVLALFCGFVMLAQIVSTSRTGSIVGSVKDPSATVISSAKLTLINIATNANVKATADSNGEFQLLQLTRAVYSLSAEAAGFKPGNHCHEILREPTLTEGNQKVVAKLSKLLSPLFFSFVSKIAVLCHILPDISVNVAGLGGDR
jgi:hypothetical protein